MAYRPKENRNNIAEKVYKRLYTKIPLNRAVPLSSLPVPVRWILTIPPWDTKLNSIGGVPVTRTCLPLQIPLWSCPNNGYKRDRRQHSN